MHCMAVEFQGETFVDQLEVRILPFHGLLETTIGGYGMPKISWKNFADGSQTSKFTKLFSLESFPLHNNCLASLFVVLVADNGVSVNNYTNLSRHYYLQLSPFFFFLFQPKKPMISESDSEEDFPLVSYT